jgi:hypothetical protein
MKRICFVSLDNINRVPYLFKYIEEISGEYDIVYWNRNLSEENCGAANNFNFKFQMPTGTSLKSQLKKLIGYLKFRKFATKILEENDYSGVVLLTGNLSVLLGGVLLRKYRKRYIVDIRDYWMENFKLFYMLEKKMIYNSSQTVISSAAYKRFLPEYDYVLCHNSQMLNMDIIKSFRTKDKGLKDSKSPIVISCIGGVKNVEYDKKVLNFFANDNRFIIRYIGRGYGGLKKYCIENKIKNVIIQDEFPMDQTLEFYKSTDIILNMYGNNTPKLDFALSNKLYFAAQLGMPILVCNSTYMAEISTNYGFGIAIDIKDNTDKDKIDNYYRNINWQDFYQKCDRFINKFNTDNENFKKQIREFEKLTT